MKIAFNSVYHMLNIANKHYKPERQTYFPGTKILDEITGEKE